MYGRLACFLLLCSAAATSPAADPFTPSTMTLAGDAAVTNEYNHRDVDIDFTLDGAPGKVFLFITTRDRGWDIGEVRNGYRGWHYVNKIDTCIYYDTGTDYTEGSHTITWDCRNTDGGEISRGVYFYYLYAYDNRSPKIKALQSEHTYYGWPQLKYVNHEIVPLDVDGEPLPNPIIYIDPWSGNVEDGTVRARWFIGSDPDYPDAAQETCLFQPSSYNAHLLVADPYEDDHVFIMDTDSEPFTETIRRWEWVSHGSAAQDTTWGVHDGAFVYDLTNVDHGWDAMLQLFFYAGEDILVAGNTGHLGDGDEAELLRIDALDGFELDRLQITDWWVNMEDGAKDGQQNGGPDHANVHYRDYGNGRVIMGGHGACLVHMIHPASGDEPENFNVWANTNGDEVGDRNFTKDAINPWVCFDYDATPNTHCLDYDSNGFVVQASKGLGTLAFGLYGPDGTGIGNYGYDYDDSFDKDDLLPMHFHEYIDVGGPYDGLYVDSTLLTSPSPNLQEQNDIQSLFWVAHDSFKGVIDYRPPTIGVEETAPAAFTVEQNSPNPFNPSTTITFTLPDAADTTVDIFTVAGQKTATVAEEFMAAGRHSVVWNAADCAAGVYFCRVQSGGHAQTIRMTLVK